MKVLAAAALVVLLAAPLRAQEEQQKPPDYSRDTLMRLFAEGEEPERPEGNVKWSIGQVEFKAAGMRWRIGYLPFFLPLSGSVMGTRGWTLPDPFLLTGTEYATSPRSFRDRRNVSAEMKRIDRITKRATVKVEP